MSDTVNFWKEPLPEGQEQIVMKVQSLTTFDRAEVLAVLKASWIDFQTNKTTTNVNFISQVSGFPTDVVVIIMNAMGKVLKKELI